MPTSKARLVPRRRAAAGFSLVEISIVVLIMAGLAAVAVASLAGRQEEALLRRDLAQATQFLVGARELAITSGRSVPVQLSQKERELTYGPNPSRILRFRKEVTLAVEGVEAAGNAGALTFYANGGSSGTALTFQSGRLETGIVVDWLTGEPRLLPIRATAHAPS